MIYPNGGGQWVHPKRRYFCQTIRRHIPLDSDLQLHHKPNADTHNTHFSRNPLLQPGDWTSVWHQKWNFKHCWLLTPNSVSQWTGLQFYLPHLPVRPYFRKLIYYSSCYVCDKLEIKSIVYRRSAAFIPMLLCFRWLPPPACSEPK